MTTATETAAPEAATAWQAQIIEQLAHADTHNATHAVVEMTGDSATLADITDNEDDAITRAAALAVDTENEVQVVSLASLTDWAASDDAFAEHPAGADIETAASDIEKPDPETGQLFKVAVDPTQPTLLGLSFSGDIALSREEAEWVDLFNKLKEGKVATLKLGVYVTSSKKTHRRDKDGNVDAVVQTKSIKITDIHLEDN